MSYKKLEDYLPDLSEPMKEADDITRVLGILIDSLQQRVKKLEEKMHRMETKGVDD